MEGLGKKAVPITGVGGQKSSGEVLRDFAIFHSVVTARPHGTLSTWPKKYSVPRNDLSWGTMYVLLCQTITKSVYLGVSTLY